MPLKNTAGYFADCKQTLETRALNNCILIRISKQSVLIRQSCLSLWLCIVLSCTPLPQFGSEKQILCANTAPKQVRTHAHTHRHTHAFTQTNMHACCWQFMSVIIKIYWRIDIGHINCHLEFHSFINLHVLKSLFSKKKKKIDVLTVVQVSLVVLLPQSQ